MDTCAAAAVLGHTAGNILYELGHTFSISADMLQHVVPDGRGGTLTRARKVPPALQRVKPSQVAARFMAGVVGAVESRESAACHAACCWITCICMYRYIHYQGHRRARHTLPHGSASQPSDDEL